MSKLSFFKVFHHEVKETRLLEQELLYKIELRILELMQATNRVCRNIKGCSVKLKVNLVSADNAQADTRILVTHIDFLKIFITQNSTRY